MTTALLTLKDICNYTGYSEKTVRKLVKNESMPARKLGGRWMSDKAEIDSWRRQRVSAGTNLK